jgi:hypothetical protein
MPIKADIIYACKCNVADGLRVLLSGPQRPDQEDRFTAIPDFGGELPPYGRALIEGLHCRCVPLTFRYMQLCAWQCIVC